MFIDTIPALELNVTRYGSYEGLTWIGTRVSRLFDKKNFCASLNFVWEIHTTLEIKIHVAIFPSSSRSMQKVNTIQTSFSLNQCGYRSLGDLGGTDHSAKAVASQELKVSRGIWYYSW